MNDPIRLVALLMLSACSTPAGPERAATTPAPATPAPATPAATTPAEENEMMVIRVVVEVQESQTDAFVAHMREEAVQVRQMPGCERYELFADPDNVSRFLLYEEWASPDAFAAYQASDLLRESFAVLGPMMAGPPDSTYFEATPQAQ